MSQLRSRKRVALIFLSALGLLWMAGLSAAEGQALKSSPVGSDECAACHQDVVKQFNATRHGKAETFRAWGFKESCASCHENAAAHLETGDAAKVSNPAKLQPAAISNTCLKCHSNQHTAAWRGSAHESSNVSCLSCHSVHHSKSREKLLAKATESETCFSCHADVRKAQFQRSTHLLRSEWGNMRLSCASCHNPHGSQTEKLLKSTSLNDTCYSCHQEKRGPFLWEHPPVKESCATCHTAHGSNNPGLLTARSTMLCQQCHVQGRHQTVAGQSNTVWVLNRGCLNCHGKIHGSNHPSGVDLDR